jgi:hypothetical protein
VKALGTTYLCYVKRGYRRWGELYLKEICEHGPIVKVTNEKTGAFMVTRERVLFLASIFDGRQVRSCPSCLTRIQCPTCARRGARATDCEECKGLGTIEVNTGGWISVDGSRMGWLKWVALRKNVSHEYWRAKHEVGSPNYCPTCGGQGRFWESKVFGAFFPTALMRVSDDSLSTVTETGIRTVSVETANKIWSHNGRMIDSGYYLTLDVNDETSTQLARELSGRFKVPTTLHGGLLLFEDPLRIFIKRFMGVKKWEHPWLESV